MSVPVSAWPTPAASDAQSEPPTIQYFQKTPIYESSDGTRGEQTHLLVVAEGRTVGLEAVSR